MVLIALIAVCLWYLTQYNRRRCVAVIDKYRFVERTSENVLQIQFHFTEPADMAGQPWDFVVTQAPANYFPKTIESGTRVTFHYQAEATWFSKKENAYRKFWKTLMYNEAKVSSDISEKLYSQILQDSAGDR